MEEGIAVKHKAKKIIKPFVLFQDNVIVNVNEEFENLTKYSKEEIIGKTINEFIEILRINSCFNFKDIINGHCYIFTKKCEPREVNITCMVLSSNEKIYYIKEKINSRIEQRSMYFEQLYKDNQIGISIYSYPDLIMLKANDNILGNVYKFKKEDAIGKTFKDIVSEYDWGIAESYFLNAKNTGKPQYIKEIDYEHALKGTKYFDITLVPIPVNGIVKYIVETMTDVTENVNNRRLIKTQKKELESIIENMLDGVFVVDKNSNITASNKTLRNFINNSNIKNTSDLFKDSLYYDSDGNLITSYEMLLNRIFNGDKIKKNFRIIAIRDGETHHLSINASRIYDIEGNVDKSIIDVRNITEQVNKDKLINEQNQIKAQYDILNNTIENLQLQFTLITYPDNKISYMNKRAFDFIRKINPQLESIESCIGKNVFEIYNIKEHKASKKDRKFHSRTTNKEFCISEMDKYVKVIHQPLYNLNNEISEIAIIGIDITEEIQAKNKLEEAYKVQSEIFINVSHELKTPLNVIYSAVQMMEMYMKNIPLEDNRENILNYIKITKQNCYRFIKLINNILDTSKIKSGFLELSLSNVNIVEVVEEIAQSVSGYIISKGINIIFKTDIKEKYVACDVSKIERILLNLISNAVKFSHENSNIYINVSNKNDFVEISVKDTGIGIAKNKLKNIFNIYYQADKSLSRNAEGSGIGLSLVKSFVDMHGGKISVESIIGKGTTFKVELPSKTLGENEVAITSDKKNFKDNKIEMINIEFSDIYSIM